MASTGGQKNLQLQMQTRPETPRHVSFCSSRASLDGAASSFIASRSRLIDKDGIHGNNNRATQGRGRWLGLHFESNAKPSDQVRKFQFCAAGSKDPSAIGSWSCKTPNYKTIVAVCEHFDFAGGFKKEPERGAKLQELIRTWIAFHKEAQVHPGDGPTDTAQEFFDKHSEWADDLTEGSEGTPGRRDFGRKGWPLTLIRKFYTHSWICHQPEMLVRSRKYAHHFGHEMNAEGAGMKVFRTDSLERSNLIFFHAYFQIYSRRPDVICYEAGMNNLRKLFNDACDDRAKFWCRHCGSRGYVQEKSYRKHEDELCHQAADAHARETC